MPGALLSRLFHICLEVYGERQMHNPFEELKKNPVLRKRLKRNAKSAPSAKKHTDPLPAELLSEEDVFLQAVSGVTPLTPGGRSVAPSTRPTKPKMPAAPSFPKLLEEHIEFDMEYSHEFLTGQVRGLDSKMFQKLKSGQFSIQAHLDLHGLNAAQARLALSDFLRRSYMEGKRSVLVITGRGLNSPDGQGVLRQELSTWLTQAPLKRIVLAFTTALPKHGGSGAVYLLLRRIRKDQGKVVWEEIFTDLDG